MILEELIDSIAKSWSFLQDENKIKNKTVKRYHLPEENGRGFCHTYTIGQIAGFISMDFIPKESLSLCINSSYRYAAWFSQLSAEHIYSKENDKQIPLPENITFTGNGITDDITTIFYGSKRIKGILIVFSPDKYDRYIKEKFGMDIGSKLENSAAGQDRLHLPEIPLIISQIERGLEANISLTTPLFYESKLHELISVYINGIENTKALGSRSERALSNEDIQNISKVSNFICTHTDEACDTNTLSAIACMSRAKLKYTFKLVQGCTISEFRSSVKANKARRLLSCTKLSIKEIASQLSFKKTGSFSEFFKKATGFSPVSYRKLYER